MKIQRTNQPGHSARRSGFTIAEMMVVIVIIGLLAGMVAPRMFAYFGQAQSAVVKADIKKITEAIENYQMANAMKAPESLEQLVNPPDGSEGYFGKIPKDPWGNPYQYDPPSGGRKFRVFTLGEDGAPGGEGKDADIDNIMLFESEE